jgi:3-phosphoshikimate 1-carboxyvinyltransferase
MHSPAMEAYLAGPGGTLSGDMSMPGDKSISHRAAILGAIAQGETVVENFCPGQDCLDTMRALEALGVHFEYAEDRAQLTVHGVGMHGLREACKPLDLGNSGTGMRLLCGLLAGAGVSSELTGDDSLRRRPMQHIVTPLNAMGADICAMDGRAPLKIKGGLGLQGMRFESRMASAQLKSCLLLAGLYASGCTELDVPLSRDHTERMLPDFGCPVSSKDGVITVMGGASLNATTISVPGDISAAMFVMVGASIAPGSDVLLRGIGVNPRRDGGLRILRRMGADIDIELQPRATPDEEPIADVRIRGSKSLDGVTVPAEWVADAIDEFPVLFIAAACASGTTHMRGIGALRDKESDRINTMATGLRNLGVSVEETDDSLSIHGGVLQGGTVESGGDHRVAMAFAISSLVSKEAICINDCANVKTSWPSFDKRMRELGLEIALP